LPRKSSRTSRDDLVVSGHTSKELASHTYI
jgi:hypothetical protein